MFLTCIPCRTELKAAGIPKREWMKTTRVVYSHADSKGINHGHCPRCGGENVWA